MADRSEINFSSLDHLNVALSAQKAGVLQSEFRQLVTLVHAPDNLRGLMCLLSNLSKLMPLAIEIARLENDEETIDEILSPTGITTEKLLKLSDVFRSEGYTQLFSTKLMSAFDIFKRQFSKSPVYACLGLRPQGNEADRGFDLLQAHLLIFSTRYFGNDLGSHENLFRAMADLCDLKYWKDLASLPDAIMTSDRYYDQLRDCESERLHVIGTLFDELPKKIRKRKREKPNVKKRKRKTPLTQIFPGGFGKISALPASRKTLLTDDDADEYEKGGGRPEEIQPPVEEIPLDVPEDVLSGATFRNLCFMAKAESNRRAMNNQLFRPSWHEASLHDLSVLIGYLQGSLDLPVNTPSTIQVRVLLYLSLFTSRDVQALLDWIVLSPGHDDEDSIEGVCADMSGQLYARIFSPGPDITDENRGREWPQAYPVITHSYIPLPYICPEIQEYLNSTDKLPGADLFSGDVKSRYQEAYQVIRRLRNVRSSRMSRGRISQYMINELSRREGEDLPKAALYFGLDIELATTRVHYSIAHLPAMENSYRILCNNITADLDLPAAFDSCAATISPDAYVGSPFCPRPDAVQELIGEMHRRLTGFSEIDLRNKGSLIEYHNGYTLYCALQTAYASGNRAISDRSFKTKEVDTVSGMAVISDKDTPDYYSTRQVWIHPMCREQIKQYQQHLLALFDWTGLDSPPLFSLFKNLFWPNVLTSFFIFTEKDLNCFEQLTPSLLRTTLAMEYGYDMPPNSNRHFLKNQLLNYQCPQEVVEAFLGHWHNGQEPWCSLSGLHPADYRNELQKHLSAILDACGWRFLPSKLL